MGYSGVLFLEGDEAPIAAVVSFEGDELRISAGKGQIGSWSLANCRIRQDGDRFLLEVEEDRGSFAPQDRTAFVKEVNDRWGPLNLAAAVAAARKIAHPSEPSSIPEAESTVVRAPAGQMARGVWWLVGAGAILVVVAVGLALAGVGSGRGGTVLSAIPTTTTSPSRPAVFSSGVDQVGPAWNEAASELRVDLFLLDPPLTNRMQVGMAAGMTFYATEDPATGLVRTMMISAPPTEGDDGRVVLAAWGILVAMVNPELDGPGRRDLLDRLGIDPERPVSLGLSTETIEGGASYWLRSGVLGGKVLLAVQPAD